MTPSTRPNRLGGVELSGEENTDSFARRASSFGTAAAAYAEHRPGYADAAVRWALSPVRDRHPLRALDLAAGTGKLTATLVRLAAGVTAVEPDPAMLAELRRELGSAPALRTLAGTAEEIPLPDASVDAVLVGQAMHWFDLDRAIPEIARVLTPGGALAALRNVDDDRIGWVATLTEISKGNRRGRVRLPDGHGRAADHAEVAFLRHAEGEHPARPGDDTHRADPARVPHLDPRARRS